MTDRTCSVDGCDRPHYGLGFCRAHWGRYRQTGNPGPAQIGAYVRKGETCTVEGCLNPGYARGWCEKHYRWWLANGNLSLPAPTIRPTECLIEGCVKPARSCGLCRMHYARKLRHGDPLIVRVKLHPPGTFDYFRIHDRVRRMRGRAAEYPCVACGKTAKDWAHIHDTDPDDISNYQPMCHPCHMGWYDYDQIQERRIQTIARRKREAS